MEFLSIETFNQLLQKWNGKNIKISKIELDDLDETWMQLDNVSYSSNTRRLDDYEPMHSLHLNGSGQIQTENNHVEQLPSSDYVIPLEDSSLYEFDGEQFLLSTDRGVYKIELASD